MDETVVLVIRGAMAARDQLEWLSAPGAEMAFVHLPGFHSPALPEPGIVGFAEHFDALIAERFAHRSIVVLGISVGAIVAAAMRAPQIRAKVLVEPFFSTAHLWPLHEMIRPLLTAENTALARWVWNVLGIGRDRIEERNYGHALRDDVPIHALVGDVPLLPRRPMYGLPSLTTDRDLALLRTVGARIEWAASRHNVPEDAPEAIQRVLQAALSEADKRHEELADGARSRGRAAAT